MKKQNQGMEKVVPTLKELKKIKNCKNKGSVYTAQHNQK
jgi:hypothetical protein